MEEIIARLALELNQTKNYVQNVVELLDGEIPFLHRALPQRNDWSNG